MLMNTQAPSREPSHERQTLREKFLVVKSDMETVEIEKEAVERRLRTVRDAVLTSDDLRLQERLRKIESALSDSLASLFHMPDPAHPIQEKDGVDFRQFSDFIVAETGNCVFMYQYARRDRSKHIPQFCFTDAAGLKGMIEEEQEWKVIADEIEAEGGVWGY